MKKLKKNWYTMETIRSQLNYIHKSMKMSNKFVPFRSLRSRVQPGESCRKKDEKKRLQSAERFRRKTVQREKR